jgi:hypothetical protein
MKVAHFSFILVCALTVSFAWQLRHEVSKVLYFVLGIGVGCAMVGLLTH